MKNKGQSLLELATFGAILIGLIALLVQYGMDNNFKQQVKQQAFRKAISASMKRPQQLLAGEGFNTAIPTEKKKRAARGSAYVVYVKDKHIPSASDIFGVGSVSPYMAASSITKDNRLNETPDYEDELPILTVEIENMQDGEPKNKVYEYTTAGFGYQCIPDECGEPYIEKLEEIFGASSVWQDKIKQKKGKKKPVVCSSPIPGQAGTEFKIIDSCEGQIMNYEQCSTQCEMFKAKSERCQHECEIARAGIEAKVRGDERARSSKKERCQQICEVDIPEPWYCQEIVKAVSGQGILKDYASDSSKSMGLQTDSSKQATVKQNESVKKESAKSVLTTDKINWSTTSDREIILINHAKDADGRKHIGGSLATEPVSTTVSQNEELKWKDSKW